MRAAALAVAATLLAGCPTPDLPADDTDTVDLDAHDPLSRPASPTLSPSAFATSDTCATCHPDHAAAWKTSSHAYAMVDPVFRALSAARTADHGGRQTQFCTACHSAIGTRGGECVDGFSFDDVSPVVAEGVTCTACHTIASVERVHDAGHVLDPAGPMRGPIADPVDTVAHASAGSDLFTSATLCGSCHDVVETSGLPLERAWQEWSESPAAEEGRTCQDCHMPSASGTAAIGGPDRTVHSHAFVGVDLPLTQGFLEGPARDALREAITAQLRGAARLTIAPAADAPAGGQLDLFVTVENLVDGHALPTGSTFNRQLWLHVLVTDDNGTVVYESGGRDANGDLRNRWSELDPYGDPDLVTLGSAFVDDKGAPTLFPWKAAEQTSTAIPAGQERTWTYFVPVPTSAQGPLHVAVELRFRQLPPFLVRMLGLADEAERLEFHDVASASVDVGVVSP